MLDVSLCARGTPHLINLVPVCLSNLVVTKLMQNSAIKYIES